MKTAAIITGATGGIGMALQAAFRDADYRVVATDRVAGSEQDGFVDIDLDRLCADDEYRRGSIATLRSALDGAPLSALVNNAAVQILGATEALTVADWRSTLHVNVMAPFLLAQAFLPELSTSRGAVINIGSIHGRLTKRGFVAYATSKAALGGLTRALAVDLGPRVRVNAIAPAATATAMLEAGFEGKPDQRAALDQAHPVARIATPEEVAHLAVFLCSPQAAFISGAVMDIDGGIGGRLHDPD